MRARDRRDSLEAVAESKAEGVGTEIAHQIDDVVDRGCH